jgi:hypothetical protein
LLLLMRLIAAVLLTTLQMCKPGRIHPTDAWQMRNVL